MVSWMFEIALCLHRIDVSHEGTEGVTLHPEDARFFFAELCENENRGLLHREHVVLYAILGW